VVGAQTRRALLHTALADPRARPAITIALAIGAALGLGVAWPLVAAAFLAGLVYRGDASRVGFAAQHVVFAGLFGVADPPWVAVLLLATYATGEYDRRALIVLLIAALLAVALPVEWTVLAALLAVLMLVRAGRTVRRRLEARAGAHQR
jgi:hypothetical protein